MTIPEPGLELDKLIAEKVLGWYHESDVGGPRAWWYSPDDSIHPKELPKFSTDIKAAWSLVERFRFYISPIKGEQEQWIAFSPGKARRASISSSAPHTICLATLAEVESDDD